MSQDIEFTDARDVAEILRKIRRIEIFTKRKVNDLFSGEYHSVFKGQGMEFDEVREYQAGDDVRTIDWNVTARMGVPYIKRFTEERELVVLFLLDVSASGKFGTQLKTKLDTAAEICALLAFSAIQNNDKVGAIVFSDHVEEYIPPKKGRGHVLHVIRKVLSHRPRGRGTNIASALEFLLKVTKRRAIVFVLSDFISPEFDRPLAMASRRFDLVAINIRDPREMDIGTATMVRLWDQEHGTERLIDLGGRSARDRFKNYIRTRDDQLQQLFRSSGVDTIDIDTEQDYTKPLSLFFRARKRL